jgi:glycine cleavage system H lipoate-binding protein/ABC-type phosphate transport system substrate-binding protein
MKKAYLILILASLSLTWGFCTSVYQSNDTNPKDTLRIISSENFSGLVNSLIEEFRISSPDLELKVELVNEGSIESIPAGASFLLTSDPAKGYSNPGKWSITVGRDILVPRVSSTNPYLDMLMERGIKPSEFASLFNSNKNFRWGTLFEEAGSDRIQLFIDNRKTTADQLNMFTGVDSQLISNSCTVVYEDLVKMVSNTNLSIGFCRLSDIMWTSSSGFKDGVKVIPIDNNENGIIDHFEDYNELYSDINRAVWIGKYPKSLYSKINLVANEKPADDISKRFVESLLTSGQSLLLENGYTELLIGERRSGLNEIYSGDTIYAVSTPAYAKVSKGFYWLIGIVVLIMGGGLIVMFSSKTSSVRDNDSSNNQVLQREKISVPAGIMFDKSHTWSFMDKNGMVKVGVSDFLQHLTGKITRIIPKKPGESVKRGDPIITVVQAGKQLVLYSPVSGVIESVNEDVEYAGSVVNSSPYEEGWIYEIKPSKWMAENRNFLMSDSYREWLASEIVRLKEFLSSTIFRPRESTLIPVLQEGGEVVDNLLESMGPDLWVEFQTGFIDRAL